MADAVQVDTRDLLSFRKELGLLVEDQLPFATAAALTDTARQAASFVKNALVEHFELRNRSLGNAIRFQRAEKRQRPIHAIVGTAAWAEFLTLQSTGGVKRSRDGHRVSIPTREVKRSASGRVVARDRPRALRSGKGFAQPLLDKQGIIAVLRKKRLRVFYLLVSSAKIPARWPFRQEVEETVSANLGTNFLRRAQEALATRRR